MSETMHAMAVPKNAAKAGSKPTATPARAMRLQRKCACGGGGADCESCGKKNPKEMLQRKAAPGAPAAVPATAVTRSQPAPVKPSVPQNVATAPRKPAVIPGKSSPAAAAAKPMAPEHVAGMPGADAKTKAEKTTASGTVAVTESKKPIVDSAQVPPVVRRVLDTPGQPLDPVARSSMESRFGRSFRDVRVHTDALAAESARAVYAHAYTVGQHIVFDSGQYQPETPEGRHLLAHELAHTIQQHGLQKFSNDITMDHSGDYQHLEREAESVSRSVMRQPETRSTPVSTRSAGRPTLSRISTTDVISCDVDESERKWTDVSGKKNLMAAKVKRYSIPDSDVKSDKNNDGTRKTGKVIVAVDMEEPFVLPAEKGNVIDVWKQRMSGCNLEAIIDPGAGEVKTKAGLKQQRPKTDQLRAIWLQRVGWTSGADAKWLQAVKATEAGKKNPTQAESTSSFVPTKAVGSDCQVDHILELQIGGNNTPENMQMLDGPNNEKSGRDIFNDLAGKAVRVRDAIESDIPGVKVQSVLMRFSSIKPSSPICGPCCQADAEASKIKETGASAASGVEYPLMAGGFATTIVAATATEANVALAGSAVPRNKSASTLIPGLSLSDWKRNPKKKEDGGLVHATLDPKSGGGKGKTALPESLKGENPFNLHRDPRDGKLTLAEKRPNVKFHYGYLSEGTFTGLKIEDDGSLSGTGTITPSFKFLPKFDIAFDKNQLALSKEIPKEKLKLPVPGIKVTDAKVGLVLGPEFKPEGHVAFELDAGKRKILDGEINLSADADGLVAQGKVHAFLPGVDNAEGNISLKNKQWSGSVKIETTQLQSKLKYVKSGSLEVVFNDSGMSAEGAVVLDLPGTKGVDAKLHYEAGAKRWVFRGRGKFEIPRLKEAELEIEYDGEHLSGGTGPAGIEFEFQGINGNIHLKYYDETFSGKGKLDVKKGKATGSIEVVMHPGKTHPTFSGKGSITYQLSENVVTTVGIEIDEHEKVRLTGALEFPKPIPLFKPLEGNYKFFDIGVSIPIPGASIGPIGLKARIDGSLSAGYKLGPGELRNTKIEAAFNPLDEKPDADVILTSTLFIGASAHITGRIAGSVAVDVGIASVEGGLAVTATASLDGRVQSEATIHYQKSRIEFDANFDLLLGLALILALHAFVKAEAGVGPFTVETEKDWTLASYTYDTGLKFGMKLKKPIHYASDEPTKLPSFDDIEWITPTIDPGDVLSKVFGSSASKES